MSRPAKSALSRSHYCSVANVPKLGNIGLRVYNNHSCDNYRGRNRFQLFYDCSITGYPILILKSILKYLHSKPNGLLIMPRLNILFLSVR